MANILVSTIASQAAKYGNREALRHKDCKTDKWISTGWNEFHKSVERTALALKILGVEETDTIAIFSQNRVEMFFTDYAAFTNRAIPVPLYATASKEQVEYIVKDAGIKHIFVGNQTQYEIARQVQQSTSLIKHIVYYQDDVIPHSDDTDSIAFASLIKKADKATDTDIAEVARRREAGRSDDLACLIYTSGTTGEPKGVMLTHDNFDKQLDEHYRMLTEVDDSDISMNFLPLTHIFERAWSYFCLLRGIVVVINTDPKEIQIAIRETQPTVMCSVPRFWEKVYTAVQDRLGKMTGIKRIMVRRALKIGKIRNLDYIRKGKKVPFWIERQYQFFDSSIFKRVRRVIGVENGKLFPTAGAPLSDNITEFLHCLGINICIGYGLSESTATVSCFRTPYFKIGSIGTPLKSLQVKIGENNEILVKGPSIMIGYYNKPEANAEAFTSDGFFRTGDAGRIDEWGNLYMTERIKDLYKTSNGKYIAPQVLESRLSEDPFIDQSAVIGDQKKYVTAFIVPAFEALEEYAQNNGIKYDDINELVKDKAIYDMLDSRIKELQKDFAGYEQIKRFTILPRPFSIETGELTNTLKVKRNVINRLYAEEINAMYK